MAILNGVAAESVEAAPIRETAVAEDAPAQPSATKTGPSFKNAATAALGVQRILDQVELASFANDFLTCNAHHQNDGATATVSPATPTSTTAPPAQHEQHADKLGLSLADLDVYRSLWSEVDSGASSDCVTGKVALAFFQSSALPKATLKTIWGLADTASPKGKLSQQEFFVALKLVAMAQAGQTVAVAGIGRKLPLPEIGSNLVGCKAAAGKQQPIQPPCNANHTNAPNQVDEE